MDRLLRERGGRSSLDIVSQLRIEDYATAQIQLGKVTRRLELMGAVSAGGNKRSSLVDTYTAFSARVERLAAELPPLRTSAMPVGTDIGDLNEDELVDRATEILRRLLERRAVQRQGDAHLAAAIADHAGLPVQTIAGPTGEAVESTPAPEPKPCPYCYAPTPADCARRKEQDYAIWDVLHALDPEEQQRRQQEADEAEKDARLFLATGFISSRMRERDEARRPKPTEAEQRQAAERRKLGWDVGVVDANGVYRYRE